VETVSFTASITAFQAPSQEHFVSQPVTRQALTLDDSLGDCESVQSFDFESGRFEDTLLLVSQLSQNVGKRPWPVNLSEVVHFSEYGSATFISSATRTYTNPLVINSEWHFRPASPNLSHEAMGKGQLGMIKERQNPGVLEPALHHNQAANSERARILCKLPDLCQLRLCPVISYSLPVEADLNPAAVEHMHHFRYMLEGVPIPQY
jgi:hypothetical protein